MEDEAVIVPQHLSLPSAPKSALGPEIDLASIPSMGPYKAHVTNLQYEVTEEQLTDLFKGLNVSVNCLFIGFYLPNMSFSPLHRLSVFACTRRTAVQTALQTSSLALETTSLTP